MPDWVWCRVFSEYFGVDLAVSFLQCSVCSSSSTGCSYQKDKQTKTLNLPKSSPLSEIEDNWIEKYFIMFNFSKNKVLPLNGSSRSEEKYELVFCLSDVRTGHISTVISKRL